MIMKKIWRWMKKIQRFKTFIENHIVEEDTKDEEDMEMDEEDKRIFKV
jgi:hypothetical protein